MSKKSPLFTKDKILIVDFGSQVTKLIARRIRELKVYCEIVNLKEFKNINNFNNIRGLILSGGPSTVTKKNFPKISKEIFQNNIPVLGICYGLQLIAKIFKLKNDDNQEESNLKTVILLNPKNEEAIYNLALLKIRKSNYSETKKLLDNFKKNCQNMCQKSDELRDKLSSITKQ